MKWKKSLNKIENLLLFFIKKKDINQIVKKDYLKKPELFSLMFLY